MTDIAAIIQKVSYGAIPIIFAITVHEVAHGYVAKRLGDRTAEMMGRLTLNPVKHMDPIGTVVVPLLTLVFLGFPFGWAKPVPIAARNLRNPHKDMVWVALAGPGANLLMALFWALAAKVGMLLPPTVGHFLLSMATVGMLANVFLAVLNLLPIPPLDGGRVVKGLVPPRFSHYFDTVEPFGILVVLALFSLGVLSQVLTVPVRHILSFLFRITGL